MAYMKTSEIMGNDETYIVQSNGAKRKRLICSNGKEMVAAGHTQYALFSNRGVNVNIQIHAFDKISVNLHNNVACSGAQTSIWMQETKIFHFTCAIRYSTLCAMWLCVWVYMCQCVTAAIKETHIQTYTHAEYKQLWPKPETKKDEGKYTHTRMIYWLRILYTWNLNKWNKMK